MSVSVVVESGAVVLRAQLGQKVILVSGNFPGSGGSVRYPLLAPTPGTVLEIRDVPAGHPELQRLMAEFGELVDTAAMQAEWNRLLARLAEIDGLLGGAR